MTMFGGYGPERSLRRDATLDEADDPRP
jgi:hypothetical protein